MTESALLLILLLAIGMPILLHLTLYRPLLRRLSAWNVLERNYRGVKIPTGGGVLLLVSVTATLFAMMLVVPEMYRQREAIYFLSGSIATALWGWQDDVAGDHRIKGFRGHVGTLWREQRMTSGFLKAWGGFGTSLLIALGISRNPWDMLVNTLLLAFSLNLINLFDLRPGRAIKVFWFLLLLLVLLAEGEISLIIWPWLIPVVISTLLFFMIDSRAKIMLGDTGANYLGYLLGFLSILVLAFWTKVVLVLGYLYIHVLAERISFSRVIESKGWLQQIDRLGTSTGRSEGRNS